MAAEFEPIPKIWRFHLFYLVLTLVLGIAVYPHHSAVSLFMVSGFTLVGLLAALSQHQLAAHLLAVAVGLGTPVVFIGSLAPGFTLALFLIIFSALYAARRFLF